MKQREMEFKMERPGLLKEGDAVTVSEGLLPSNYYYTINPSLAMSGNIPFTQRLHASKGVVKSVIENERGFYVTALFEEEGVGYAAAILRMGSEQLLEMNVKKIQAEKGMKPVFGTEGAAQTAGKMPLRNAIYCFLGALIWGTAFVAQQVGGDEIPALAFVGQRFLMGCIVLLPLVAMRKRARKRRREQGDLHAEEPDHRQAVIGGIVCGTALMVASVLQQAAIAHVAVGKAGFLTALYIIMVPMLSLIFTRRSSAKVWIAAVIAAAGLYCLCSKAGESFSIGPWELMLLACALAFSIQIMSVDYFAVRTDGVELACIQFLVTGLLGTAAAALHGELPMQSVSAEALLSLCYAGIFSSGIAYTLQVVGQKGADPAIASLIMSLESVISAVSGFFLLHQTLSIRELAGCVLMSGAIVLVQLPLQRKKDSTQ